MREIDTDVIVGTEPKCKYDWQRLKNINHVLDLQTGSNWLIYDGHPLENQLLAARYNMIGWSHPLGSILPPTKCELIEAVEMMRKYKPIYVHCKNGVDRTGMVVAAYRVLVNGWTPAAAVQEMRDNGSSWWLWFWWFRFLTLFK